MARMEPLAGVLRQTGNNTGRERLYRRNLEMLYRHIRMLSEKVKFNWS